MAGLKHVKNVLLKGSVIESFLQPGRTLSSQRKACVNLWILCERKIVYEFRSSSLWYWNFSSTRLYARSSASLPSPTHEKRTQTDLISKQDVNNQTYTNQYNPELVETLLNNMDGDMPISEMPDPFVKDYPRCFICRFNIEPDHKNVRLLSQFVSPYTGRIYGRAITGLCIPMQKHIAKLIKRARTSGFMPVMMKDPKYLQDPQPYDAMAKRKHF